MLFTILFVTLKPTTHGQYSDRHLLVCCGANSSTCTMSRNGCEAILPNQYHRHNVTAILAGDISIALTSSLCLIPGNIPGSQRGILRSIALRWACLIWILPSSKYSYCFKNGI